MQVDSDVSSPHSPPRDVDAEYEEDQLAEPPSAPMQLQHVQMASSARSHSVRATSPVPLPLADVAPQGRRLGRPTPSTLARLTMLTSCQGYDEHDYEGDADEGVDVDDDADGDYGADARPRKKAPKKKRSSAAPRPSRRTLLYHPSPCPALTPGSATYPASGSDSDSDYGSHSKKKKRARYEETRSSGRGRTRVNYYDDQNLDEHLGADSDVDMGYEQAYPDPNVYALAEEDEIEAVLGHSRDEQHLDDPQDEWQMNMVRKFATNVFSHH